MIAATLALERKREHAQDRVSEQQRHDVEADQEEEPGHIERHQRIDQEIRGDRAEHPQHGVRQHDERPHEEEFRVDRQEQVHRRAADQGPHRRAQEIVEGHDPPGQNACQGLHRAKTVEGGLSKANRGRSANAPPPFRLLPVTRHCVEARIVLPVGTRVSSTMACISASGALVISETTTMATSETGMPMMPKRRWSMDHSCSPPL